MELINLNPLNTATNTTHLLWVGRWIEVRSVPYFCGGSAWEFKSGRDAADWLLWPS